MKIATHTIYTTFLVKYVKSFDITYRGLSSHGNIGQNKYKLSNTDVKNFPDEKLIKYSGISSQRVTTDIVGSDSEAVPCLEQLKHFE